MDKHDEQFETFLRQFRMRQPSRLPELVSRNRWALRFGVVAAAAVIAIAVASTVLIRNSAGKKPYATVEMTGNPSIYKVGEKIEAGTIVRSNSAAGLLVALNDGSHVEMRAQSELLLEAAADGIRVRLNDGGILVMAAKQHAGHLYVQTRDATISVVGTVFYVNAEQFGTKVAVVEGEVHVQHGQTLDRLLPGERTATSPKIQLKSVAEEIAWSRSAAKYMVMLPQAPAPLAGGLPEVQSNDVPAPNVPGLSKGVLPFEVKASYVGNGDEVRTLITVQILTRDLAFQDTGGAQTAQANINGVIYRADNRRIPGFSHLMKIELPSLKARIENLDQPNVFQETRYLVPGKYKLHLTVEDTNSQNAKVMDYLLTVPRVPDQALQASSMILAYSITDLPKSALGSEIFALGDKKVIPNVTGVFRVDQNLNVWQEAYGLTVDPATHKPSATYELVISQNWQEIKKLVTQSAEMKYMNSVPLTDFPPGPYDVQIRVTDNLARTSFVTTSPFSVVSSSSNPAHASAPQPQNDSPNNAGPAIFNRACTTCHSGNVMDRTNYATRNEYAALVGRQASMGAMVSESEFPILVDYVFATYGKKSDPPPPSDIPLQRQ